MHNISNSVTLSFHKTVLYFVITWLNLVRRKIERSIKISGNTFFFRITREVKYIEYGTMGSIANIIKGFLQHN